MIYSKKHVFIFRLPLGIRPNSNNEMQRRQNLPVVPSGLEAPMLAITQS